MGAVFFRGQGNSLLVRINGNSFNELANAIRICGGRFRHNEQTVDGFVEDKIWLVDERNAQECVNKIKEIEPKIIVPNWIQTVNKQNFVGPHNDKFLRFRTSINPDLVKSEYKGDYQRRGILRGISQNRLALFWEMGCGKSYVVITIMNHLIYRGSVNKIVILCPPEGVLNLKCEFLRFNSFGLKEDEIYICSVFNRRPFDDPNIKVIIMTYRNLIMLYDDYYKEKTGHRFTGKRIVKNYIPFEKLGPKLAVICDESAAFKNHQSKTWKILYRVKDYFDYRYILTGTPAPKYAADLWTQLYFLHSGAVPDDYYQYITRIADVGNKFSAYGINYYFDDKVKEFMDSTAYLVSREKMEGNLDLPELIMRPVRCLIPKKQNELYRAVADYVLYTLKESDGAVYPSKLKTKFMLLCMALHDPGLLSRGSLSKVDQLNDLIVKEAAKWDIEDNGKYEVAVSLLEKYILEQKKKVILWSGHPYIIDTLAEKFAKYKPMKLHGGTEMEKNESVAERNGRFCAEFLYSGCPLAIINYFALNTSVNLTAVTRNIYWDFPLRQDVMYQTVKRSHRIGTVEPVFAEFLLFGNTLEETLYNGLLDKNDFNERVWSRPQQMTVVELKKLFNGGMAA